jgi:murein DD-endopeptidase MepM/ murein hydrolase activator NlpD
MSRPKVPSRPRVWPRVAVLVLVGVAVAGCENSARFDSNPFASNRDASRQDITGSVTSRPVSNSSVVSQPLPAPSRLATVASASTAPYGERGFAAYQPSAPASDVTGSVPARRTSSAKPAENWTWDGGSAVTVGRGETLEAIARRSGVPAYAIMQTNAISNPAMIRPGQRLVIPRYVYDTQHTRKPAPEAKRTADNVHIVAPGEGLMQIARSNGVTLAALARANNLQPFSKLKIGDRLTIPGGRKLAARHAPPPRVVPPRAAAPEKVASIPTEHARLAKPEVHETKSVTHKAEPAGGIPSFRWPVKGRIIAGFGPRPNGSQNDGINLAVPEGTPIKATDDGVVAYAGNELKGYGNLVLIRHSGGFVSAYANASKLLVKRGDTVKRGEVIARAGQTGNVTSPQLHFEIRKGSTPVDPTKYLNGA